MMQDVDQDSSDSEDEDYGPERSGPYGYPTHHVKTVMPSYRDVQREVSTFCIYSIGPDIKSDGFLH